MKGDNSIGVLGTSETLSFADTDNFGELQPVIALNAAGGHYPGGSNGFAELALNDPFMAAPTALGAADQWGDERSDLVVADGKVYTIDSDVLGDHSSGQAGLTAHANARLAAAGPIGTGAIIQNLDFLSGVGIGGDPDLFDPGSSTDLDMDVAADGVVFFTEMLDQTPPYSTRLTAFAPTSGTKTVVSDDLSVAIEGSPGRLVEDLRVIKTGTTYRAFVLFDDDTLHEADINLTAAQRITGYQALAPSSAPDGNAVIDGNGNWLTADDDGKGLLRVYRESLHGGAPTRTVVGQVQLPFLDWAEDLWVDRLGHVFVLTTNGIYRFTPSGSALVPEGYVLAGHTYYTDAERGEGDSISKQVELEPGSSWFGK